MKHSTVFYLTEAEFTESDYSRFHEQCNPIRSKSLKEYIASLGKMEFHVAGLLTLPPDELIADPEFRKHVRKLGQEWPSYWAFLRINPPCLFYHLATQCQTVTMLADDKHNTCRLLLPVDEVISSILLFYRASVIEATACSVPWVVLVGRLWDILQSLHINLFNRSDAEITWEHPMPYVHVVTMDEVQRADVSSLKRLFAAAITDCKTASAMRGSIQLRLDETTVNAGGPELRNWAIKAITDLPDCAFLLTRDERGILLLLRLTIPDNTDLQRLEPTELFHHLALHFPTLVELEKQVGNSEIHAVGTLRQIFKLLGYDFCK